MTVRRGVVEVAWTFSIGLVAIGAGPLQNATFPACGITPLVIRENPRTISEGGRGCTKNYLDGRTKRLKRTGARGPES
jgi:hypothetical protein